MPYAVCRDCSAIQDSAVAPMRRLRVGPAGRPCRVARPRHRPHRLRCLLRLRRETRRSNPGRPAADRRARGRARRGHDRLLSRPHLRRALGDADVPGAGAVPGRGGAAAKHGQVQARERGDPRHLPVGHAAGRAGFAGRGLSRPDRRASHHGTDSGAGAGRDRPAYRERGRHHRVDRAGARTSSWPSSPPSCTSPPAIR